jgi:hypothetical protein
MFFKFFQSGNYNQTKQIECFICCSDHGKSDKEMLFEYQTINYPLISLVTTNYPLISLGSAYGCKCNTSYAHNKCLLTIKKCPTCRKVSNPNLYVKTRYDYYLKYLLVWLKKDQLNVYKLYWYMIYCVIFGILLLGIYVMYENKIKERNIIPKKSFTNLCCSLSVILLTHIPFYVLIIFNDYLRKYWLYNPNTKKYDVFNNESTITSITAREALFELELLRLRSTINRLQNRNYTQSNLIIRLRNRIMRLEQQIS